MATSAKQTTLKRKIPPTTAHHLRQLKKGMAVRLIKAPKGKRIFWYKDGIHYKFVNL